MTDVGPAQGAQRMFTLDSTNEGEYSSSATSQSVLTPRASGSDSPSSSIRSPPNTSSSFQFDPNVQAKVNPLYALSQKSDRVYHIVSAGHGKTKIIEGDPNELCTHSTKDSLHRVWTSLSHLESPTVSSENLRKRRHAHSTGPDGPTDGADGEEAGSDSRHSSRPHTPISGLFERFHPHFHPLRSKHASSDQHSLTLPTPPALRPPSLPPTPPLSERQSEDDHFDTADEAMASPTEIEDDTQTLSRTMDASSARPQQFTDEPEEMQELHIKREDVVVAAVVDTTSPADAETGKTEGGKQIVTLQTSTAAATVTPSQPMTYLAVPSRQLAAASNERTRPSSPMSQVSFSSSIPSTSTSTGPSPMRLDLRRNNSAQALTIAMPKSAPPNAVASSSRTLIVPNTSAGGSIGPTSTVSSPGGKSRAKSPIRQSSANSYMDAAVQMPTSEMPSSRLEDSIAKEADEIRKERLSRRLEREREQQAQQAAAQFTSHPHAYKRERSTSKGKDGDEHSRGWAQPMPQPGLLQRAGTMIEDKPLIGNLIGEDHVNYVLMYNMLTGIRIGVSRCQAKPKRPLVDEDYTAQHKFSFDIIGNELTPSARYDFKFKDYAPWVFRDLREHFMLDPADYLLSLTAKYILSEMGSPGKSGSFFYFSRDYRFIIKTIHHAEHKFLRKVLKPYHDHVKSNPHTLISRFYGLHRVKLPRGRKIHFVIMNNLMPPHRDVHETYDLKGSTVKREYPEDKAVLNPHATLKDLNWIHRGKRMQLGPEKRALFSEQLKQDTAFLKKLGVMDYSLLLGFHDMARGNTEKLREGALSMFNPETSPKLRRRQTQREREQDPSAVRMAVERSDPKAIGDINWLPDKDRSERRHFYFYQDEGGYQATDAFDHSLPTIYYMGIIDILTPWSCKKVLENFFKGLTNDRHAISPVPPTEYGNRFQNFIINCTETKEEAEKRQEMKEKKPRRVSAEKPLAPTSEKVKVQ